ncbi:MAG: NTPase [bacterium]
MKTSNLLITGMPGVGKTTLIKKLVAELATLHPVGFYTREIRQGGVRRGFELVTLDGQRQVLAAVDIRSRYRVGKYRVDVAAFEEVIENIPYRDPSSHLAIIDEIGKMECMSQKFHFLVNRILESDKLLIATVAARGSGLIADVRQRRDIVLFEITRSNRDVLLPEILAIIRQ